jgi:hypothetical protein
VGRDAAVDLAGIAAIPLRVGARDVGAGLTAILLARAVTIGAGVLLIVGAASM